MSQIYVPKGPYFFQSGKNIGKSTEMLMFSDYDKLCYIYQKMKKNTQNKNSLHLHLEWLIEKGENRIPQAICPNCKNNTNTVNYFSVRYSSYKAMPSFGQGYTYCNNCIEGIDQNLGQIQIYNFKWSNILKISKIKIDQKQLYKLYRWAFVLPSRLNAELVFQFFKDDKQSPDAVYL